MIMDSFSEDIISNQPRIAKNQLVSTKKNFFYSYNYSLTFLIKNCLPSLCNMDTIWVSP